jgi:DNA-binding response OmpR family regulator
MVTELKHILLVEDDPRDVELILGSLAEYNLANEIIVAIDGEEALDYLYSRGKFKARPGNNPALVLLDLNLPKVSGMEVLKQIRSDAKLKMIPVLILTSSREDKDWIEGSDLGITAYVVKPLDSHEFVKAVKNLGAFCAVMNKPPPESISYLLRYISFG